MQFNTVIKTNLTIPGVVGIPFFKSSQKSRWIFVELAVNPHNIPLQTGTHDLSHLNNLVKHVKFVLKLFKVWMYNLLIDKYKAFKVPVTLN